MRSANQSFNNHVSNLTDKKLIETVHCSLACAKYLAKAYKDARARENTWKEVPSQVTEQIANRNNLI